MSGQAVPMTNGTAAPFNWGKFFSLDNKWIAPMFITTILVVGKFVVWDARELQEDGHCDCGEPDYGTDSVEDIFWQVADSGERLYQRDQRGDSGAIAGGLALFRVRGGFDHVEVRAAGEQSAYLESVELRDCGAGVFGAGDGGDAEHSVGKLFAADDRDLVFGIGDHCAAASDFISPGLMWRVLLRWRLCGVGLRGVRGSRKWRR